MVTATNLKELYLQVSIKDHLGFTTVWWRLCLPLGKYVRLWLQTASSLWLVCGSHMAHFSVAGRMSSSAELLNCDLYQGLTDSDT